MEMDGERERERERERGISGGERFSFVSFSFMGV
jgi:hypothetical protein